MNIKIEYQPSVIIKDGILRYFIQFKDVNKKQQITEVSKGIFLQFFGVHKHVANSNMHSIVYQEQSIIIEQIMTKEEYKEYKSFKSIQIRENSVFDRYLEHLDLSESQLHKRLKNDTKPIIDTIYTNDLIKIMYIAINELPPIQKRRLILHYFNGYSLSQIAKIQHCSKSSVQCSIDIAIKTLRGKIIKFSN